MLTLDVIISTLNERVIQFLMKLKTTKPIQHLNFVVVCQSPSDEVKKQAADLAKDLTFLQLFFQEGKGLSRGRNLALLHSKADICLISDDDLDYDENIYQIVTDAYQDSSIDAVTFNALVPERKNVLLHSFNHSKFSLAKIISFEISFRKKSIDKNHLKFDENFGLGAQFPTGEEYIFMVDCYNKHLKIVHEPKFIVNHPQISSGQVFTNDNILARGAMIARVFPSSYYFFNFLFSIFKQKLYIKNMSFFEFVKLINLGSKNYINFKSK